MTATRSEIDSASSWSWVTKTVRDAQLLLDLADVLADPHPQLRVEVAQGLVQQQDGRTLHECACQRDPLLLTSRDPGRPAPGVVGEVHEFEHRVHPLGDLGLSQLAQLEAERDVVEHVHVRPQCVALEHHCGRPAFGAEPGDVVVGDRDGAGVGLDEPGDHAQCCRLAAPPRVRAGRPARHVRL